MTTSTINGLATEQTTQLTDDMFVMQTAAGVTKKIKATNMKLVGFDNIPIQFTAIANTGATAPTLTVLRTGITLPTFNGVSTLNELFGTIVIPHTYVASTAVYFYINWAHAIASPTGNAVWQIGYSIAKSDGTALPAITNLTTVATPGVQYGNVKTETASVSSASIEVDSVITVRLFRDPTHGSDTFANDIMLLSAGLHIQTDSKTTVGRTSPYTKV